MQVLLSRAVVTNLRSSHSIAGAQKAIENTVRGYALGSKHSWPNVGGLLRKNKAVPMLFRLNWLINSH